MCVCGRELGSKRSEIEGKEKEVLEVCVLMYRDSVNGWLVQKSRCMREIDDSVVGLLASITLPSWWQWGSYSTG